MTFSKSRIVLVALGAIVTVVLGVAYRGSLLKGPAKVKEAAPASAVVKPVSPPVALKGGATRALAGEPGKLLVVHFWATWCAPCEEELPGLVAWWREAKADTRIDLVAVSVDEKWATVDGFLAKRNAADLPLALDPKKSAASAFGTEKFPETWFVSPAGEVVYHQVGALDWSAPASRTMLRVIAEKALGPSPAAS